MLKFSCPRRFVLVVPAPDYWHEKAGVLRCSYCGSVEPSVAIKALQDGWTVEPGSGPLRTLYPPDPAGSVEFLELQVSHLSDTQVGGYNKALAGQHTG